ncbi:glycosyltransferase family 25 protein [Aquirufa novilacunae]|uniref:Glycosyltransferase family 25 protein n=1 Tax=Aquirufa novilacunae TaxID=3139305 RepID=A0ABW8U3P6_9BACT
MFKRAFVLFAEHETERKAHVEAMRSALPALEVVKPVFPSRVHVPFVEALIEKSYERTGKGLLSTEIGVILSHRKVWTQIARESSKEHFLVLESDSRILKPELLKPETAEKYDLFFWGAWNGYASLKRSSKENGVGEPLIKSVYGAYGYSLNAKAAKYLLKKTARIAYPVDMYKCFVDPKEISIGAIVPEVISTWRTSDSMIRQESRGHLLTAELIRMIFYCRNTIQSYFC